VNLDQAYRRCEQITTEQARNFSYGIKLLPAPKRKAMSALYAMARRIDDIGDGDGPASEKLAALAETRKDLAAIASAGRYLPSDDPVIVALADATVRFGIPVPALEEIVEGCEMDVNGACYQTFEDLVGYCRRVAGSVGRLSLAIYGSREPARAEPLADALGVALQITNILRDIVEDHRAMGRVYLPAEDRERFGVPADLIARPDDMYALIAFEAARAEEWYEKGLALLPLLDWRSRACTAAMAGIYRRLLTAIQRDPAGVLRGRMSLPGWQKAAVAAQALARGTA
jgi:15-cis-phytoene synthase